VYQSPQSYTPQPYGEAEPYKMPRPARPRRTGRFLGIGILAFIVFMVFGFSYLVTPEPRVAAKAGIGLAAVDGRQVVLTPYDRQGGRGMFQVIVSPLFQVRLAATDPATGDVVWDVRLSEQLIWDAAVLAAGDEYAYVATEDGLVVLDVRDGSIVSQGSGVEGLGGSYIADIKAYAYDAANRRVLAMNANGGVVALALDSAAAVPADEATTAAWIGKLTAKPPAQAVTATRGALDADAKIELRPRPNGGPGNVLVKVAADDTETLVSDAAFFGATIVRTGEMAAGVASGHVLVKHNRTVNDTGVELSAVSLATGVVTSSVPLGSAPDGVVTRADGSTVVAAGNQLVTAGADGRLAAVPLGKADFFGNPS
jgi:hypothetical protein